MVSIYSRFAGTQLGSSLLFGGAFFSGTVATDGLAQAVDAAALAAASWFAAMPLLKRAIGGR
jgi:hypothetical protein